MQKPRKSYKQEWFVVVAWFPALDQFSEELPGKLYSMDELNQETENKGLILETPPTILMKIGVARDWPDARALW